MAKVRRRRARDTWKEKQWYKITAPTEFGEEEIGITPARDPKILMKRRVESSLRELTGDFSKQYIKLYFQIKDVAGDTAKTRFVGHQVTTDYVRSMIRRGTSRVDALTNVKTKDNYKIRIHTLAITTRRAKSSQQRLMRETIDNLVQDAASEKTFHEFVDTVVSGKLASEVYHEIKKIYPLKRVEIIKTLVVEEPT